MNFLVAMVAETVRKGQCAAVSASPPSPLCLTRLFRKGLVSSTHFARVVFHIQTKGAGGATHIAREAKDAAAEKMRTSDASMLGRFFLEELGLAKRTPPPPSAGPVGPQARLSSTRSRSSRDRQ